MEKNPCKRRVSCPYASVIPFTVVNAARCQPYNCTRAILRESLRVTLPEQRKCLTLTPKPSLIDVIPLYGGGRRVHKSGLIDAISDTTTLAKREVEDAVNALVPAVVGEVCHERRVTVVGFDSVNPTQRGARMEHDAPSQRSSGVPRPHRPRSVPRRGKQHSDRPTRPYGGLRCSLRPSAPRRGKQHSDRPRRP